MKLLGKVKKNKDSGASTTDSLQELRNTLEMLDKTESHLQSKADAQLKIAKEMVKKNKKAAANALKRKKAYEGQIQRISGARMNIENQIMTIESAQMSLNAMKAMKAGSDSLKKIHGDMGLDKVDETMEDIQEQVDVANEISEAIASPISFGLDIDEDELEAELNELEEEEMDLELMDATTVPSATPTAGETVSTPVAPVADEVDEDAELKELEASMTM